MRKRLGVIILLMAVTAVIFGCSGNTSSKKEVTKEDDPEMIFKEAVEKLEKETKKAIETESVTSYDNEMEDEEVYTCIIDTKKNIVERISEDVSEEADYYYFNVKEKDGYGVYVNDRLTDGKWKHYKEELEGGDESEYEYWLGEFNPAYTEEKGYSNIVFSNEGEDELNGVKTVKIKVTADEAYDTGEELAEEMTRKSVLEEYEWSEEEVELVDGFSDILDNYIAASNQSVGETTVKAVLTVWIDAKDRTLLKSRSETNIGDAQDDASKMAVETFNNEYWKVDMIHQSIKDGMSKEEAKKALEADLNAMEEPVETAGDAEEAGEEFDGEEGIDDFAAVTKIVVTKNIMSGKDCPKMDELPKDYEEIKQAEYFEGGFAPLEEDDFFPEDDEFDDEAE